MADTLHDSPIRATPGRVFEAVTTPAGLDSWWTRRSAGQPVPGAEYELWFGPEHDWRAKVTRCIAAAEFEIELVRADADWTGTRVGFRLEEQAGGTRVRFHHAGWPSVNDHYRTSCYCWAMYLRILRRYLEHGDRVPYEDRLDA